MAFEAYFSGNPCSKNSMQKPGEKKNRTFRRLIGPEGKKESFTEKTKNTVLWQDARKDRSENL